MIPVLFTVPSAGRAKEQPTFDTLRRCAPDVLTLLVVPPGEVGRFTRYPFGLLQAIDAKGIAPTRQKLFELAEGLGVQKLFMFDDDLRFGAREPGTIKLHPASDAEITAMLDLLVGWLSPEIPAVGISQRGGNNFVTGDYVEAARMMDAYGFHMPTLLSLGIRFDRVQCMEDMDVTLQLLRAKKPNRVTYQYTIDQTDGRNSEGGCSLWRTSAVQREAALTLAKLHPDFVTVREGVDSGGWEGMGERTDVRVQWKKAFEQEATGQGSLF